MNSQALGEHFLPVAACFFALNDLWSRKITARCYYTKLQASSTILPSTPIHLKITKIESIYLK